MCERMQRLNKLAFVTEEETSFSSSFPSNLLSFSQLFESTNLRVRERSSIISLQTALNPGVASFSPLPSFTAAAATDQLGKSYRGWWEECCRKEREIINEDSRGERGEREAYQHSFSPEKPDLVTEG